MKHMSFCQKQKRLCVTCDDETATPSLARFICHRQCSQAMQLIALGSAVLTKCNIVGVATSFVRSTTLFAARQPRFVSAKAE